MPYTFHLLNVFTRDAARLSGNPLCVVENAVGLESEAMQALARQFNLSETTFVLPSARATARVRIFTPDYEMPFAGHPTLGTAHIVRRLGAGSNRLTLEMQAGIIAVVAQGNMWTLSANPAAHREINMTRGALAAVLGLNAGEIIWERPGPRPLWVDSGSDQLIVPLASPDAVERASPSANFSDTLRNAQGQCMAYVFAQAGDGLVMSRFFFQADNSFREDPATGSACANLGGWYLATGTAPPLSRRIHQGDQVKRPSTLFLHIDAAGHTSVAGEVAHLGTGSINL